VRRIGQSRAASGFWGLTVSKRARAGKGSELAVAAELIRHGLDVFLPCVDDQGIDLLLRVEDSHGARHYDVQVKSVHGYNRIVGLRRVQEKSDRYILIIHYRHDAKPDEFFYLTRTQVMEHWLGDDAAWGDLIFNKPHREKHASQDLKHLAEAIERCEV